MQAGERGAGAPGLRSPRKGCHAGQPSTAVKMAPQVPGCRYQTAFSVAATLRDEPRSTRTSSSGTLAAPRPTRHAGSTVAEAAGAARGAQHNQWHLAIHADEALWHGRRGRRAVAAGRRGRHSIVLLLSSKSKRCSVMRGACCRAFCPIVRFIRPCCCGCGDLNARSKLAAGRRRVHPRQQHPPISAALAGGGHQGLGSLPLPKIASSPSWASICGQRGKACDVTQQEGLCNSASRGLLHANSEYRPCPTACLHHGGGCLPRCCRLCSKMWSLQTKKQAGLKKPLEGKED